MSVPGTDLQGWKWLRGRAGRAEYWLWTVVILAWAYLFTWARDPLPLMVLQWTFWFQMIRRLHDFGRSGWWILSFFFVETLVTFATALAPAPNWLGTLYGLVLLLG